MGRLRHRLSPATGRRLRRDTHGSVVRFLPFPLVISAESWYHTLTDEMGIWPHYPNISVLLYQMCLRLSTPSDSIFLRAGFLLPQTGKCPAQAHINNRRAARWAARLFVIYYDIIWRLSTAWRRRGSRRPAAAGAASPPPAPYERRRSASRSWGCPSSSGAADSEWPRRSCR